MRPAKSIERKMLVEAFRSLVAWGKLSAYRYVGFGSTFFSDFILFHKALGIHDMISIERNEGEKDRFDFNRPFKCVRLEYGRSNDILPKLSWAIRTILWLDYDKKLDLYALRDIETFCANAVAGSVLVVSVNAHPFDTIGDRLSAMKARLPDRVPRDVEEKNLVQWGTANVSRRIIDDKIHVALNNRNGGLPTGAQLLYKQLFNFHYRDGARMLTVGGVIYDEGQTSKIAASDVEALSFVKSGVEPYTIDVPSLTPREIRHIDAQLPYVDNVSSIQVPSIDEQDVEKYALIYRYYPSFVEAEL